MNDHKPKRDKFDGTGVATDEDHEVEHLARKLGISVGAVRELIRQYGNNRATLERRVWKLKGQ